MKRRILVGIPTLDNVYWKFFLHTTTLVAKLARQYEVDLCTINRTAIDRAREITVDAALAKDADWILFIDDDTILPMETVDLLSETLEADDSRISVSGICYQRGYPWWPMIYKYEDFDWEKGRLHNQLIPPFPKTPFRISCNGMGVCLLRVKHLSEIPTPRFGRFGSGTEDFFFYNKVRTTGYEVWCDPRVRAVHLGEPLEVNEDLAEMARTEDVKETARLNPPSKGKNVLEPSYDSDDLAYGRGKKLEVEI